MEQKINHIGELINGIRNNVSYSESVVRYYELTRQPKEFNDPITGELRKIDYLSNDIIHVNQPFVFYFDIYFLNDHLKGLFSQIKERRIIINDVIVSTIEQLEEHLTYYKKGFLDGYHSFEEHEIISKSSVFKSDGLSVKKITDYVELHKKRDNGNFTFNSLKPKSYFVEYPSAKKLPFPIEECYSNQNKGICSGRIPPGNGIMFKNQGTKLCKACFQSTINKPEDWYRCGINAGSYYKAWYIVLANFKLFDKYFENINKRDLMKKRSMPPLSDCFLDKNYLNTLLENPKVADLFDLQNDTYVLKKGKKAYLAGLAHRLFNIGKLNKDIIKTNQDLARVFCPYFHVNFNETDEKQFQPERAKIDDFKFIE